VLTLLVKRDSVTQSLVADKSEGLLKFLTNNATSVGLNYCPLGAQAVHYGAQVDPTTT
jgi:hypothetical protein